MGEVIVRDFGRLLGSGRHGAARSPLGRYRRSVLTGLSQSGWFVDTFVAEGFNRDPWDDRRVYDGAVTVASAGNWLAINQLGDDGRPQQPYVGPDGRPFPAGEIMTRPQTDPYFVEAVAYTDFYRLRAALARGPHPPDRARRYTWPAPHVPSFFVDDTFVFDTLGCNDGEVGLSERRLPPSSEFELGGERPRSEYFNDLPGAEVGVPEVDRDAQPEGGVRFPHVEWPLGRLEPVALPPVTTTGMSAICGNFSGYQPTPAAELEERYGDVDAYEDRVGTVVDNLVARDLILENDRQWILDELRRRFETAPQTAPS